MSTTELFLTTILLAFTIGAIAGWLLAYLFVAWPFERDANLNHARLMRTYGERTDRIHRGTPHIPGPGVRTVNAQPMYSSDWLSDGLGPAALPPTELRSVR
jgi:hypothetical protein